MARAGIFQIPSEMKDQDKWFKYFTKKQACIIFLVGMFDYRCLMWAGTHKAIIPILIFVIIFTGIIASAIFIPLPSDILYLNGGGIMLDQWLIRVWIRKKNRVLYTKNYKEDLE